MLYHLDGQSSPTRSNDYFSDHTSACWVLKYLGTSNGWYFATNTCSQSRMSTKRYTRIVLNERPVTDITPTTFRIEEVAFDLRPGQGEVLVQVNWVSLDPGMRVMLKDIRSYAPPVQIGDVMGAGGLATVVEAGEGCKLQPGDVVSCFPGK